MLFCFHMFICLMLIFFQTTLKYALPAISGFYDLAIPFICYLSIKQHIAINIIMVILLGYAMDSFSGGPFGIYISAYIWYLGVINVISGMFNMTNFFIMSLTITFGVFFQNVIFYGSLLAAGVLPDDAADIFSQQIFWAITTGTLMCTALMHLSETADRWMHRLTDKKRTALNC